MGIEWLGPLLLILAVLVSKFGSQTGSATQESVYTISRHRGFPRLSTL